MTNLQAIISHQAALKQCRSCPDMLGPVVVGHPVISSVMLIGQAPGDKEGAAGKPFAWTAGKTLFRWFEQIGMSESSFRQTVYMAAVCRCFPGKQPKGGDRVPSQPEIDRCRCWLDQEIELLHPRLILPVGKLAIAQFLAMDKLTQVIGKTFTIELAGSPVDLIPLPHPSGASTWHRTEPGKGLLQSALSQIESHPAWRHLCPV